MVIISMWQVMEKFSILFWISKNTGYHSIGLEGEFVRIECIHHGKEAEKAIVFPYEIK